MTDTDADRLAEIRAADEQCVIDVGNLGWQALKYQRRFLLHLLDERDAEIARLRPEREWRPIDDDAKHATRTRRGDADVIPHGEPMQQYYQPNRCHSASDGECFWKDCPQLRDGEPERTGRHCPLDDSGDWA